MKVRRVSIATQLFFVMTILIIVSNIVLGVILYKRASGIMMTQIRENATNIAACAAASIDGAMFETIDLEDYDTDAYQTIYESLTLLHDNAGVEYIYTVRPDDRQGAVFVVDPDTEEPAGIGDPFEYSDSTIAAFNGEIMADEEPYTDEWGTHLSAYAPILDGSRVTGAVAEGDLASGALLEKIEAAFEGSAD